VAQRLAPPKQFGFQLSLRGQRVCNFLLCGKRFFDLVLKFHNLSADVGLHFIPGALGFGGHFFKLAPAVHHLSKCAVKIVFSKQQHGN
jgi:hypothetical protein